MTQARWKPDHDRQPARDGRGLVVAYVLKPAHVPFDVRADRRQRVQLLVDAPAQEYARVGLGIYPTGAAVA